MERSESNENQFAPRIAKGTSCRFKSFFIGTVPWLDILSMLHSFTKSLLKSASSFAFHTYASSLHQLFSFQHVRQSLGSVHSKGTSTPFDSALTEPAFLTSVESTLTKIGGGGIPCLRGVTLRNLIYLGSRALLPGVCLLSGVLGTAGQESKPAAALPPPVHLTSEQDHQRLMDLLNIKELSPGPDGNPKSPNAANVDESKVTPYRLPDPLRFNDGTRVTSAKEWWTKRRPEIVEIFDREVCGRVPAQTPTVRWEVTGVTQEDNDGIPAITKKLVGHVDNSAYPLITVDIQLTLTTPENAHGPVPVMMEFAISPEILAAMKKRLTPEQWASFVGTGPTWQHQVLAKGWGYAILIPRSVQADNGEGLTEGIIGLV